MVARKFTVLLEPAEERRFVVKCVELPVASEGETKEETLNNIKEAIEGYQKLKQNSLIAISKASKIESIFIELLFKRKIAF